MSPVEAVTHGGGMVLVSLISRKLAESSPRLVAKGGQHKVPVADRRVR